MNLSGNSIIKSLAFFSIVIMISTLITAGTIACEDLTNYTESSKQINSGDITDLNKKTVTHP